MGYAKVRSVALVGVTGQLVMVEADVAAGLPNLVVSGLPDASVHESRDRVRAAIVNSGERWPQQRITVNLLPAHLPKHGSGYDMAVAVAVLAGAGVLPIAALDGVVLLGELGLDGTVRPVRGVLPAVLAAVRGGVGRVVVPLANAAEADLVPGVTVRAADTLRRLIDFIRGADRLLDPPRAEQPPAEPGTDLADVVGQERCRWAPSGPVRAAGRRQDHAGPAAALGAAGPRRRGGAGGDGGTFDRRCAARRQPVGAPPAVPGAAPYRHDGGIGRRRLRDSAAGSRVAGTPRCALP